jgi:hypothetical protein
MSRCGCPHEEGQAPYVGPEAGDGGRRASPGPQSRAGPTRRAKETVSRLCTCRERERVPRDIGGIYRRPHLQQSSLVGCGSQRGLISGVEELASREVQRSVQPRAESVLWCLESLRQQLQPCRQVLHHACTAPGEVAIVMVRRLNEPCAFRTLGGPERANRVWPVP